MTEPVGTILKFEEGYRSEPYYCINGYPTVGYGRLLGAKGVPLSTFTQIVYKAAEEKWMECHAMALGDQLRKDPRFEAAWLQCNEVRRAVLISMAYQMGVDGLAGFVNTIRHIERREFDFASLEMLRSKWARQTPERAGRHSEMMASGKLLRVYE